MSTMDLTALGDLTHRDLHFRVEQFLFAEAELLDQWRLHEWLGLFAHDAYYEIPATDKPDGDPRRDLFLVHDDRFLLEQRVNSLLTRAAHAEYPHSSTRRIIGNVRLTSVEGSRIEVAANFAVYRCRAGVTDIYAGTHKHVLEATEDGSFRFVRRTAILAHDALRPHGKVSILL